MGKRTAFRGILGIGGLALLLACDMPAVQPAAVPAPPTVAAPPAAEPPPRSARSEQLARYYQRVQNDLVAQGLLRRDGGGPDTPFTPDQLARNFEQIAFFDEYAGGSGISTRASAVPGKLRRWAGPIRIGIEFGASVSAEQRAQDEASLRAYAARMSRLTAHPISQVAAGGNFTVLVMSEDDNAELQARLRRLIPDMSPKTRSIFSNLPRSIHCLVVAFSGGGSPQNYTRAVAVVRAEHPDLLRLSCFHEEVAQGLGLANDSPGARPSIFNDDDEFALLTNHDELLLRMLYDPRLTQGMSLDEARPVIRIIARELMGQRM